MPFVCVCVRVVCAGKIDELTSSINGELESVSRMLAARRGRPAAPQSQAPRGGPPGPAPCAGRAASAEELEASRVRRQVARRLVRDASERKARARGGGGGAGGGGSDSRVRMLDRSGLTGQLMAGSEAERLLAKSSRYFERAVGPGSDDVCCICLDPLAKPKGGVLRLNRCGHIFHGLCILKWFELTERKQVFQCPMCKSEINHSQASSR